MRYNPSIKVDYLMLGFLFVWTMPNELFNFIEMFYNPKKRHSHTGGVSPAKFEEAYFSELQTV